MTEFLLRDSRPEYKVLHPSTGASLEALAELKARGAQPATVLDMGCGSGMLSLAAAELWENMQILAADISAQAVADARDNITRHGLEERISVIHSDGFAHELIKNNKFDLIISNLIAELQVKLAVDMAACLAPGGMLLLSGILGWLRAPTEQAFQTLGFELAMEIQQDNWHTLLLTR